MNTNNTNSQNVSHSYYNMCCLLCIQQFKHIFYHKKSHPIYQCLIITHLLPTYYFPISTYGITSITYLLLHKNAPGYLVNPTHKTRGQDLLVYLN